MFDFSKMCLGGEKGSADTARDPRGFAIKFYTEDGNWDLVGNNTPIFFMRDPILVCIFLFLSFTLFLYVYYIYIKQILLLYESFVYSIENFSSLNKCNIISQVKFATLRLASPLVNFVQLLALASPHIDFVQFLGFQYSQCASFILN